MFWPSWTVRLTPPEGIYARSLAPVLAALLLIPDSRTSLDQAAGLAGDVIDGIEISRLLQELDDLPQWPDIITALDRLADHLDAADVPIDYGRRQLLDYTGLLPHDRWLTICRRTGTPPGTGRRERIARSQLFRRLSGLPAESVPDDLGGLDSAEFRATSLRFAALQTPELTHALQQEALNFLASHHIHDEPVTWQPPTALRTADEAEALPAVLRKALTGSFARQRLSRFLAARSYPTLTEAARDLGIRQSALVTQINRLEEDLGQPLFERAERGRAMKLTRFGKRVAAAAQTITAEEMPRR